MDQAELKEFFSVLVANPAAVDAVHAPQLKTLVELYPQSGILRALLARSSQVVDQNGFQQKLKSAAVYAPDRAVLYNLINYPEKLVKYIEPLPESFVEDEETLFEDDYSAYNESGDTENYIEEPVYEETPINYFHESEEIFQQPENNFVQPETNFYQPEETYAPYQPVTPVEEYQQPEEVSTYNYTPVPEQQVETAPLTDYNYTQPVYQQPEVVEQPAPVYQQSEVNEQPSTYYESPAYLEPVEEEQPEPYAFSYLEPEPEVVLPPIPGYIKPTFEEEMLIASVAAASVIDDEIYDEITGIEDIYIEPIQKHRKDIPDVSLQEQETAPVIDNPDELEGIIAAQYGEEDNRQFITEEAEPVSTYAPAEPVSEQVAVETYSTTEEVKEEEPYYSPANDEVDFEMVEEPVAEPVRKARPTPMANKPVNNLPQFAKDADERVSMYNDEKMPYSFLWWLDKTRKEHSDTYQPYVAFKPIIQEVKRPSTGGDELQQQYFENIFHITSVEQLDMHTREKQKEGEIIDRFIQQDPQLKPPNTEKLDNENKAKKSSEDQNELVSETLARIYLDQMLYTKAIATYQKLMLKFPEKSSYFVAQIKLLEKKIN